VAQLFSLGHIERYEETTRGYSIILSVGSSHLWRIAFDVAGVEFGSSRETEHIVGRFLHGFYSVACP
jgi:hypothetical protein